MSIIMKTPAVSMEAFSFQVTNIERIELTNAIEEMRRTNKFDSKLLSAIVNKHHNLSIQFILSQERAPNAYVLPPKVDKNNPLINQWRRVFASNNDGINAINFTAGDAIGSVNFEKGKVSGVFSKMTSNIYITKGAWEGYNGLELTAGELTAMIMHEVGHIMTYFATLGQSFTTAFILDGFVRSVTKTLEPERKIKLIKEFEEATDVAISDKNLIVETEDINTITTVVLSDIVDSSRSQYGTTLYDLRSWESLSDQFAARQGCAGELATAMDKLYRIYEPMYYRSTLRFLLVEVGKALLTLLLVAGIVLTGNIIGAVVVFVMLSSSPHQREYDLPYERLQRLRTELVFELKSTITPARNEAILEDIESIDAVLSNVKKHSSFFEKFWLIISPQTRRQIKLGTELRKLETLINNDMYIEAAKLKKLK